MRSAEDRRSISSCVAAGKEVMSLRTLCFGEVDRVSFGCGKAYGAAVAGLRGLRALGDLERERSGRCRLRAALRLVGDALILRRSRRVFSPCRTIPS